MSLTLYTINRNFSSYYDYKQYREDICIYYIPQSIPHFSEFRQVCYAVYNTLKQLYSKHFTELDKNCKSYEYVSYFLYDKIKNIYTKNNFEDLYEILATILNYTVEGKKCDIIRFHMNKDEFDKKKELYFHSEILQWIKLKNEDTFYFDKDFCKNYINKCFNFYTKKIKDSDCKEFRHYEKELKNFSNNFNATIKFLKENEINIAENDIELPIKTECSSEEQSTKLTQFQDNSENRDQEMGYDSANSKPGPTSLDFSHANTNVNAGIVSGTLFGTLLLSLFFWKFTPLGSRIQHKIWSTKNNYNIENKTDEIILDTSDNEDIYSYNNEYHIQYNSA
ncbi:PIR protein [Plasmodium ovale]|uniref:PIR protein n=1 Tax=Plasmodium ovale TaxID=36330 RepID=A0A1D3JDD1_PLAOA|nr:PIR protein [Plasmodium ovale]SBT85431.1 PIR protein [Plasmodium ovale]